MDKPIVSLEADEAIGGVMKIGGHQPRAWCGVKLHQVSPEKRRICGWILP